LELTPSDCNNDGNYDLTVNFIAQNPNNAFFDLFINGEFFEFYSLGDLPITIENFPDGDLEVPYVNVCINDAPDCCFENEFVAPSCGVDCGIFALQIEPQECDAEGNFLIDFSFTVEGQDNEGFTVLGNGMNYGNFAYGELFYTVGPFVGNGVALYELIIQDLENTDCQNFIAFGAVDCSTPNLVWPGDLNNDNIANNLDLLNLGLAFNSDGEPRDMQGIEWSGLAATDWDLSFANGVNYVFADANGDGIAEGDDQNAIAVNYDLTHGDVVENYDELGDENDSELFVDLPNADAITIGQPFTAPIILGTNDLPADNIYGLAFTLVFDPTIIDPATVDIDYSTNWMGQNGVNILALDKTLAAEGEVDMVITKNDQNDISGFGQIAAFIGIIDNIAGKLEVEIFIRDVRAINRAEGTVLVQRPVEMIEITVATSNQITNNNINIYPNPATEELTITNNLNLPITAVELRNTDGKLLSIFENGAKKMDVSDLPSGVYLLKLEIAGRMYYERFVKL
jgi:hypothetical protein